MKRTVTFFLLLIANLLFSQTNITIDWREPDFIDCGDDGEFNIIGNVITIRNIEGGSEASCVPCESFNSSTQSCELNSSVEECATFSNASVDSNTPIFQFEEVTISANLSLSSSNCDFCNLSLGGNVFIFSSTKGIIGSIGTCTDTPESFVQTISVDCGESLFIEVSGRINSNTNDSLIVEVLLTGEGVVTELSPIFGGVELSNNLTCPGGQVNASLSVENCDADCDVIWTPIGGDGIPVTGQDVTLNIPDNAEGSFEYYLSIDNGVCMPISGEISIPILSSSDVEAAISLPNICPDEELQLPNPIEFDNNLITGTWSGSSVTNNIFVSTSEGPNLITFTSSNCGNIQFNSTVITAQQACIIDNNIPTLGQWGLICTFIIFLIIPVILIQANPILVGK